MVISVLGLIFRRSGSEPGSSGRWSADGTSRPPSPAFPGRPGSGRARSARPQNHNWKLRRKNWLRSLKTSFCGGLCSARLLASARLLSLDQTGGLYWRGPNGEIRMWPNNRGWSKTTWFWRLWVWILVPVKFLPMKSQLNIIHNIFGTFTASNHVREVLFAFNTCWRLQIKVADEPDSL